jgi:hypothetical protein
MSDIFEPSQAKGSSVYQRRICKKMSVIPQILDQNGGARRERESGLKLDLGLASRLCPLIEVHHIIE